MRYYTSSPEMWATGSPLQGVPKPFGASPNDASSLEWWHEYLSLVRMQDELWTVWRPRGGALHFQPCVGTPCTALPHVSNSSITERLQRTAQGFVLKEQGGESLHFEAPFVPSGAQQPDRFFLSEMRTREGVARVRLGYAPPSLATACPTGGPGSGSGVPYLSTVETVESMLVVGYRALSPASGGTECVIDRVDLVAPGEPAHTVVQYAYLADGVAERPGRVAETLWASRTESYSYDSGQLVQASSNGVQVVHTKSPDGGVIASQVTGEHIAIAGYDDWGECQPGSNCCGAVPMRRTVSVESAGRGDGLDGGAGLVRTYEFLSTWRGGEEPRLYRIEETCPDPKTCSPGTTQVEWACGTSTSPGYEKARKDKRGNWEVYGYEAPDAGMPVERTAVYRGASTMAGTDALEQETFQYIDGAQGERLLAASEKPSTLGGAGEKARTAYQYDAASNRMKASIRSGWTRVRTGAGTWTTQQRFIGTFYFTARVASGEMQADVLGRTLEVHGPCIVQSEAATDCSGSDYPLTQYYYWPSTDTSGRRNRLRVTHAYASRAATPLVTTYAQYDAWGNATEVTDANGVTTYSTYEESRLTSSRTGSGGTTYYGYDNGRLTWVQHPEGNYEVFCYRTGTAGGACTGGTLTDQMQWKAKAVDTTASSWTERVEYTYWPDGTVREERYVTSSQSGPEVRRVSRYAADAHKRPTWQAWGDGAGSYAKIQLFDGADNLIGIGLPYNNPPSGCSGVNSAGMPYATSCTGLAYDRANRLAHVDENRGSTAFRSCFEYDAQGNTALVRTGCSTSSACLSCTQPASQYTHDDFGQVVEVLLPQAEGPVRFEYDAAGNVILKETEAMRRVGEVVEYQYDALSRLVEAARVYTQPSPGREVLYALRYDEWGTVDASCPQPLRTLGRIRARIDSFGTTWYQYDDAGRVSAEIRLRTGTTTCTDASPHTLYQYTANGELRQVRYPRGRTVTYVHGTGASADRIEAVDVTLYDGTAWSTTRLLSSVIWEPYGGLRGYQLSHHTSGDLSSVEYMLGDNSSVAPAAADSCLSAPPSGSNSDRTGRLRSLRVSSGAFQPGQGAGDIYKRTYTWQKDQVWLTDTCVLGATTPKRASLFYDGVARLTGASGQNSGLPYTSRTYGYSPRGNRSSEGEDQMRSTTLTYGASPLVDRLLTRVYSSDTAAAEEYVYDADGRVVEKRLGRISETAPIRPWLAFGYGPSAEVATDTVFRAVTVNGLAYNYYYDAQGRRRAKVYPSGARDEYFYDTGHLLLSDQGNDTVLGSAGSYVEDDYVWLGGRPVALVRGRFATDWTRAADTSADCARNGEPAACGVYFPVTDHIGMPVVMLDASRRVTGLGEYEPFGHVNRMSVARGTAHPYANSQLVQVTSCQQPIGGTQNPSTSVRFRVRFGVVDTESNGGTPVDYAVVRRGIGVNATGPIGGQLQGPQVTPWLEPSSSGYIDVLFSSNASNCCPTEAGGLDCDTATCSQAPNYPYGGVSMQACEYQRFQTGAQPFWTPLRFPGQYHDAETDLFENWNRYYDPSIGRYLQPEPMASAKTEAGSWSVYSYAESNPLQSIDPTGLYIRQGECKNWDKALQLAREKAGCDAGRPGPPSCKCNPPCNICGFLTDGALPFAYIVSPGKLGGFGRNGGVGPSQTLPGGAGAAFNEMLCGNNKEYLRGIETLAKTMVHEAIHLCKYMYGIDVPGSSDAWSRPYGNWSPNADAEDITDECFSD